MDSEKYIRTAYFEINNVKQVFPWCHLWVSHPTQRDPSYYLRWHKTLDIDLSITLSHCILDQSLLIQDAIKVVSNFAINWDWAIKKKYYMAMFLISSFKLCGIVGIIKQKPAQLWNKYKDNMH